MWKWGDLAKGANSLYKSAKETVSGAVSTVGEAAPKAGGPVSNVYGDGVNLANNASGYIHRGEEAVTEGVHWVEDEVHRGSHAWANKVADVPVLGSLARSGADSVSSLTEMAGGVVGGATTLLGGVANAVVHPIDTLSGLESMVEHTSGPPGGILRAGHGIYDVATGKRSAEDAWKRAMDPRAQAEEDSRYWGAVGSHLLAPYQRSIDEGRYGEVVGRGAFDVVMLLSGLAEGKGAAVAGEGANAARVADAGRAADVAEGARAADVAEGTRGAGTSRAGTAEEAGAGERATASTGGGNGGKQSGGTPGAGNAEEAGAGQPAAASTEGGEAGGGGGKRSGDGGGGAEGGGEGGGKREGGGEGEGGGKREGGGEGEGGGKREGDGEGGAEREGDGGGEQGEEPAEELEGPALKKGKKWRSGNDPRRKFTEMDKAKNRASNERPTIKEGDWEGVKRRPDQKRISSTKKTEQLDKQSLRPGAEDPLPKPKGGKPPSGGEE